MPILTYHHIGECPPEQTGHQGLWVPPDLFRRQLVWLRDHGWHDVTLDDVLAHMRRERVLPRKWVALTFDDGWLDNYAAGLPIMRDTGFRATVFVVSGRIRQGASGSRWDDYVSAEEIREMAGAGIAIGSHTRHHARLTDMQDDEVRAELAGSRDDLAALTGEPPRWFCYPFGNFSTRIAAHVRDAGDEGACSSIRGNRVAPDQIMWMPRVMVMNDTTPNRLSYMLSGIYHIVHSIKNRRRWKKRR